MSAASAVPCCACDRHCLAEDEERVRAVFVAGVWVAAATVHFNGCSADFMAVVIEGATEILVSGKPASTNHFCGTALEYRLRRRLGVQTTAACAHAALSPRGDIVVDVHVCQVYLRELAAIALVCADVGAGALGVVLLLGERVRVTGLDHHFMETLGWRSWVHTLQRDRGGRGPVLGMSSDPSGGRALRPCGV
jgi:hypothetical protein